MADEVEDVFMDSLQLQLSEVEMLQSMFPNEEEFRLEDPGVLVDVQEFISRRSKVLPSRISFFLTVESEAKQRDDESRSLKNGAFIFEMYCSLPHDYPNEKPELYVRSPQSINREIQKKLNQELKDFLSTLDPGELCIVPAIQWLQENSLNYAEMCSKQCNNTVESYHSVKDDGQFVRMWMYMHHIYSKTKRKIILDWSSDYNLTGFSLPGKPGVVCIEGDEANVEEYYSKLRRLNWKKITCRHRQLGESNLSIDVQRVFKGFKELAFDVHGTREGHMDMGQFFQYLQKHHLSEVFPILFGVEGK
ncbi:RWD domain-containing protein 2A-like [Actinia tenebrosa]|uniref:RWD domain-containing protein 2A-like n=1 Tax=Actinia tenebrosa TaxID=6105 RepID=A0A6P8IU31_ACTTE|nr:RWD domain-containing protein 2A-like [Actinia tenebrosa]